MDFNFKFTNLLGSVYRNGTVLFSKDGNSVISPVGNKISVFDLKNNVSHTLAIESTFNICVMALHPEGTHLFAVNERGDGLYLNLISESVIYRVRLHSVHDVSFSPDGKFVAVARGGDVQVFELSATDKVSFNPFLLVHTFHLSTDDVTSVCWSDDSRLLLAGAADKQVRVFSHRNYRNFFIHPLGGHKSDVVYCDFLKDSYSVCSPLSSLPQLVSVDRRGLANIWATKLAREDLVEGVWKKDDDDVKVTPLYYNKENRINVGDASGVEKSVWVSSCTLHRDTNLLVTAFSNGVFALHELPTFSLIHNLRVSEVAIRSLAVNASGDWLALACGKGSHAELVVWEWQSESYVLKQQSHSERIRTAVFSPDGGQLATGGDDGKVKVWSCRSSFCTVTFTEHSSAVSAVCWTQQSKAVLSASLDGTVRAHDLKRYRNFRTFVCPEPTQLGSLAVDASGDLVMAGGKDLFQIFVWSMENGHLLEVLSGHSAAVTAISSFRSLLASVSFDKTLRLWNVTESQAETVDLVHEALDVAFSPDGNTVAVLTLDSAITFFHVATQTQIGSIDTKFDVDPARSEHAGITRENTAKSKSFTRIAFSPCGSLLLAGGESNFVCLYSIQDRLLVRKFALTTNRSLDGVVMDVNRRQFSEFGNMALVDDSSSDEEEHGKKRLKLAGTRHGDAAERSAKPTQETFAVAFCPSGRRFAVCSTEGVSVYSLNRTRLFSPFDLSSSVSPESVRESLSLSDFSSALAQSVRLDDSHLIALSLQSTPLSQVDLVVGSLSLPLVERLLKWMSEGNVMSNSPHLWLRSILQKHGMLLKSRHDVSILTGLQQIVQLHSQQISKLADETKFGLRYLIAARNIDRKGDSAVKKEA